MRAVPESDLPVRLPDLEDFKPTGSPEGPLVKAKDWAGAVTVTREAAATTATAR